ncbi:PilZ domain-containing protein [Sphingobium sp.]|uniref:PilZ domain-containing protein n=1 Tax=Sphingobium sp. TaxID=1912891 RepID=UPI002639FB5B|nr:PilZ domain-containing protein [Sphingobium sp.]
MQTNIAAKLYPLQRTVDRFVVNRPSTMRDQEGAPIDVVIEDISETGCRIRSDAPPMIDDEIRIGIAGIGIRSARVIWNDDRSFGCTFDDALTANDVAMTLEAATLVQGAFEKNGIAAAPETRPADELGPRAKLLIIVGAAAFSWVLFLSAAKAIQFLV